MKSGSEIRKKVSAHVFIPKNWSKFLRIDDNKNNYFSTWQLKLLLTFFQVTIKKSITVSQESTVLSLNSNDMSNISSCTHEKGDTYMILHAPDKARKEHKSIMIHTVKSDVVVIATALFYRARLEQLLIAFGMGKSFVTCQYMNMLMLLALAKLHLFSFFICSLGVIQHYVLPNGRGKRTA